MTECQPAASFAELAGRLPQRHSPNSHGDKPRASISEPQQNGAYFDSVHVKSGASAACLLVFDGRDDAAVAPANAVQVAINEVKRILSVLLPTWMK